MKNVDKLVTQSGFTCKWDHAIFRMNFRRLEQQIDVLGRSAPRGDATSHLRISGLPKDAQVEEIKEIVRKHTGLIRDCPQVDLNLEEGCAEVHFRTVEHASRCYTLFDGNRLHGKSGWAS